MELIKALNNNVALVYDDNKQEAVVMGSGVAFGLKPGGSVNESRVEKLFVLDGEKGHKDFNRLLERISLDNLELASDIIKRGEQQLGYHCNDSILLTLSDVGTCERRRVFRFSIRVGYQIDLSQGISICDDSGRRSATGFEYRDSKAGGSIYCIAFHQCEP